MSFFLLLLLIAFLYFVVFPVWRFARQVRRAQNAQKDFFRNFTQQQTRQQQQTRREAERRRKKIDPSVGEYVAFEEVETTETRQTESGTETRYERESQITDVEWEEVPEK